LTPVYNGTINTELADADGWIEITLDIPFAFNNSDNLIIAFDENTSTDHYYSNTQFCCSASPADADMSIKHVTYGSTNPDPFNPPTGTLSAFRPNVKLQFGDAQTPEIPTINASEESLDFGAVSLDEEAAMELTISNTGEQDLVIESTTATAPFTCTYSGTIPAGENAVINITFTPTEEIEYSDNLTFNITGEFNGTNTLPLTGSGLLLEPVISITEEAFDFDNVDLNDIGTTELTVNNIGDADLVIESATVAAPFACEFAATIPPGESGVITVTFAPDAQTAYSEELTINISGSFTGTNTITLTGNGINDQHHLFDNRRFRCCQSVVVNAAV